LSCIQEALKVGRTHIHASGPQTGCNDRTKGLGVRQNLTQLGASRRSRQTLNRIQLTRRQARHGKLRIIGNGKLVHRSKYGANNAAEGNAHNIDLIGTEQTSAGIIITIQIQLGDSIKTGIQV